MLTGLKKNAKQFVKNCQIARQELGNLLHQITQWQTKHAKRLSRRKAITRLRGQPLEILPFWTMAQIASFSINLSWYDFFFG